MGDFMKKKTVQQAEIFTEQNQAEEINTANIMGEQGAEPLNVQRQRDNTAREKALLDIREKLALKKEFEVDYKDMQLESAEAHLLQEEEYNNRIEEYDAQEKELLALEEKYGVKDEERLHEDSAQKASQDIFALYYANQHGNVKKMLEDVDTYRKEVRQYLENKSMSIDKKLVEYKENAVKNQTTRREEVNNRFSDDKAIASKGKKEKGRKKGLALEKSGVIGATEETYAMQKDMKHCMKRIASWNKKGAGVIEEDEVKLTGREFDVVFKNKSGSALDIKAVMEKMAKLRIVAGRLSQEDEVQKELREKYVERYKLLEKNFRIVCAANGIDSETGECFTYENEKQKEAIIKKIEYANAVYVSSMAEFKESVEKLNNGELINGQAEEIEHGIEKKRVRKEEKTKEQIVNDDYSGFMMCVTMMRQKANNPKVDDEVWNSALRICNSYDSRLFEKEEDALNARKISLQKETELLTNVLKGNVEPILTVALEKLEKLEKQNITIDSFFDNASVTANLMGYEELVSVARLVLYAKNQVKDKKELNILLGSGSFGKTEFEMHKAFTKLTIIGNKQDYENRFMENVNNMRECASERVEEQQWRLALELCKSQKSSRYGDTVEDFVQRKADLQADIDFLSGVMSNDTAVFLGEMQKQFQKLAEQGMTLATYLQNENAGEESVIHFDKILQLVFARKDAFEGEVGQKLLLESKVFGETAFELHKNFAKLAYLADPAEKKARFIDNIEKMRQKEKEEHGDGAISDTVWEAAKKLCSSYDDTRYTNKDNLLKEQKASMQNETEFMSSVLKQDAKAVMQYAFAKLEELEQQDISVTFCMDIKSINSNPEGYEKLAAVICLINATREKMTTDRNTLNTFVEQSRFKGSAVAFYKLLSNFNTIGDYASYVKKAKGYEQLPERQQKILLAEQRAMERKMGFIEESFKNKWNESNVMTAELQDVFAYEVDTDTQMARTQMEPMYNDTVNKLQEYVNGLSQNLEDVKKESRLYELVVKVSEAARMFVTGRIMQDKYEKKVQSVSGIKNERKKLLGKNIQYSESQQKEYSKLLEIVKKDLNEYSVQTQECELLRAIIAGKDTMTDEERSEKVERIMKLREASGMRKYFTGYKNDVLKAEKEKEKILKSMKTQGNTLSTIKFEKEKNLLQVDYLKWKQSYYLEEDAQKKEEAKLKCIELKRNMELLYGTGGWTEDNERAEKKELEKLTKGKYEKIISELNSTQNTIKKQDASYEEAELEYKKLAEKMDATMKKPLDDYIAEMNHRLTVHEKDRENAYQTVTKQFNKQDQSAYNYLISNMSEEEVALYMGHRGKVVLETADNVNEMVENATKELSEALAELNKNYSQEELAKYDKIEMFTQLKEAIESQKEISDDLSGKCLVNLNEEKKRLEKNAAAVAKMEKTIIEAQKVLDEAKKGCDYSEQAKKNSIEARKEFTKKCFTKVADSIVNKIVNVCKNAAGVEENNIGKLARSNRYAEYMEASEKLMEEKAAKFKESGVSYNTLALQSYLLDYSENKYNEVAVANELKQGFNKQDVYKLSEKDFKASFLKGGFATVNFQNLMYKRMMLIKWLDEHKAEEQKDDVNMPWYQKVWESFRSPKQRRYDRRKERLEKLNRYLKLYCEANGVDFETGKLFCEMDEMTDEMVTEKVMTANLYLDESSEDIKNSYFTKEAEEEEEEEEEEKEKEKDKDKNKEASVLDKIEDIKKKIRENTEFEKDIFGEESEEEEDAKLNLTEIYSIKKEWEGVALQNETDIRTAHFVGSLATKIGECKAAYKAGVGVGTIQDKKTETEKYTGGANLNAAVSFTALSSEFMAKYNRKLAGMDAEAKLSGKLEIGTASANINTTALIRDENGNFNPKLDFEVGAELALLKLEAAAGMKVYGVGVDAQLSFMLGLAAKAKGSMKDWKLSVGLQVAVGVGFSVSLELDFSGLKDALTEHAKKAKCKVKDFVTRRMLMWGIKMNSEEVQKMLLADIDKLDLDLSNLDDVSEGTIGGRSDPTPLTT